MNQTNGHTGEADYTFPSLSIIFLTIFLSFTGYSQNIYSLVQAVNHSTSAKAIIDAKRKMSGPLTKVDMKILSVVTDLKMQGVTRVSAAQQNVGKRYSNRILQMDDRGNIRAEVYLHSMDSYYLDQLKALGITVEYVNNKSKRVACIVPFDVVDKLAALSNVTGVQSIPKPMTLVGAYTTAGDTLLEASAARAGFGVDGHNTKVGVISDGVDHYENSISSGDLPSDFQVIYNRNGGDEGTAMSEIVYDLAPGTSLAFADDGTSDESFSASIDALKSAGCDVIVDDIIYFDEPMFEDGIIAQTVDAVTASGATYVSSAGNEAEGTWDGQGTSANEDEWVTFSGTDEVDSVTVGAGGYVIGDLQWADKWGLSGNDYDLYLFDGPSVSANVLASSTDSQDGEGSVPYEALYWSNDSGSPVTVYFRIYMWSTPTPREMKLVTFGYINSLSHVTDYGIFGHAAAKSCISAAAISAFTPQTVESFSSHGPSRIYYFDGSGIVDSTVDRSTPTLCGIDGVQTYVGSTGIWAPGNPYFYGTSAAAPHLAGIAALLLSKNSSLSWDQVEHSLVSTATKVTGMLGQNFTNAYGYGRANAYLAMDSVSLLPAPSITVTPDSFSVTLTEGDSTTGTMTIGNTGTSDLHWSTVINELASSFARKMSQSQRIIPTQSPSNTPAAGSLRETVRPPTLSMPRTMAATVQPFVENFETGSLSPTWVTNPDHSQQVTSATAANGTVYSLTQTRINGTSGHFDGVYADFPAIQPDHVSFWIRVGSGMVDGTQGAAYFVLGDSAVESNLGAFFFFAQGDGHFVLYPGDASFSYTTNTWYHIQFLNINWTTKTFDYYVNESLVASNLQFRAQSTSNFSRVHLYDYSPNIQAWWDEISIGGQLSSWLSVTPDSGTVAPSNTKDVTLKYNARALMFGRYNANVAIHNNDPSNNPKNVPVHLTVNIGNRPAIVVAPDSLHATITGEGNQTLSFYVKNIGTQPLTCSLSDTSLALMMTHSLSSDGIVKSKPAAKGGVLYPKIQKVTISSSGKNVRTSSYLRGNALDSRLQAMVNYLNHPPNQTSSTSWLSESPDSATVAPGDSVRFDVTFRAAGLPPGTYSATIRVSSNDPFKPIVPVIALLSKNLANFTTEDNENNLFQGIPDYDLDTYLFNDDPIAPIEFNIFDNDSGVVHRAQLNLLAWDVDWASGERDSVVFNHHFVGYLTGADNEWSTSVFSLDSSWVVRGPQGKNLVQVFIDVLNVGYPTWAVTVDWGQIILNGATGSAHIRYVVTDTTQYSPGSMVNITEEIDTDSLSENVLVETDLVDPIGDIVAGTSRTWTVTAGDEPFTESLGLDPEAASGTYQVMVIVYDATTNIQQDSRFVPFQVVLPPPTNFVAGVGFDGIVPLTWDPPSELTTSSFTRSTNGLKGIAHFMTGSGLVAKGSTRFGKDDLSAGLKIGSLLQKPELKGAAPRSTPVTQSLALDYYNVYRSTVSGGPYTFVASITTNDRTYSDDEDYIDTAVVDGQTYYYVVTAVYDQGEGQYSQEISATPAAGGQTVFSPYSVHSPVIDGVFSPGEWGDANVTDVTMPGVAQPVRMLMKNNLDTLFLAFEDVNNTTPDDFNEIGLYFDADHDRRWNADSLEGNFWIDFHSDSTYVTFRGITGTYPYPGFPTYVQNPSGIVAKASFASGHIQFEVAIDLSSQYFSSTKDTLGIWVFNSDDGTGAYNYYSSFDGIWPYGAVWVAPQNYGNLVLTKQKTLVNPLASSWNLVSWNLSPGNDSTTTILSHVMPNLVVALGFDQGGLTFDPTVPANFNTLRVMDFLHGYWLKTNNADTLAVLGVPVSPQTPIDLFGGWNLVSYLPTQADSTVHALGTVLDSTIVVQGFEGGALTYDPTIPPDFNTLQVMKPGLGYWVKTKSVDTLIYPMSSLVSSSMRQLLAAHRAIAKTQSSVAPTKEWISVWGDNVKLNGQLIPVGTIIKAIDGNGIVCGQFTVVKAGKFGLMPVYGDDPQTKVEEGPKPGEYVYLSIGDFKVPKPIPWTQFGDVINFNAVATGVDGDLWNIPTEFALHQNYPNPFNPSTTIKYDLPKQADVSVKIYNVLGQEVATLVDENQTAGYYSIQWNGSSRSGYASSGVYFCTIKAGTYNRTIKMLLVK